MDALQVLKICLSFVLYLGNKLLKMVAWHWCTAGIYFHLKVFSPLNSKIFFYLYFKIFSAGVGRSGTLIALDILLQTLKDRKDLDIFGTVMKLRRQRVKMVQTEVIKNCIYIALYLILVSLETVLIFARMHLRCNSNPEFKNKKLSKRSDLRKYRNDQKV